MGPRFRRADQECDHRSRTERNGSDIPVPVRLVGYDAAGQHADRGRTQKSGKSKIGDGELDAVQRLQGDHREIGDPTRGKVQQREKHGQAENCRREQNADRQTGRRRRAGDGGPGCHRDIVESPGKAERHGDGGPHQAGKIQRGTHPRMATDKKNDRRRDGTPQIAGECMEGERAANARRLDRRAEDRIIGRVVDRVGNPGERAGRQQPAGIREQAERAVRHAGQAKPGHQHTPRADIGPPPSPSVPAPARTRRWTR